MRMNRADYELDDPRIEAAARAKVTLEGTRTRISMFNTICEGEAVMASNWSSMKEVARREQLVVTEE